MNEQRVHERVNIELPASFEIAGREENLALATTLNISSGGICLYTKEKLSIGETLQIKVKLAHVGVVFIKVEVRWVKTFDILVSEEYQIGVRLLDSSDPDEAKFVEFCKGIIKP